MKIDVNKIDLIVYDFDGVMTNNKVIFDQNGKESVIVNRADGLAISVFRKNNIKQIILSTEKSSVVNKRAKKLQIECLNGIDNKKNALESYIKKNNLNKNNIIYIGNDINDYEVMKLVGIPIAPSDADSRVKKIAKFVTKAKGGDGVLREVLELFNIRLI